MRIGIKGLGMLVAAVLLAGATWFSWLVWGQGGSSGKMLNEVRNKAAGGASDTAKQQPLKVVESVQKLKGEYDVIVAGTDPEGVTAAISAARSGLKVLLVDGRNRDILGGLMTIGWLNTLDLNYAPEASMIPGKHNFLNKGIFQEWYDQVEGTSFDTHTAANVFYDMVRHEPNIDLLMKVKEMNPITEPSASGSGKRVAGIELVKADGSKQTVRAKAVIDATQDADVAAAAGVPFTWGREDIGDKQSQMAVTLVMKLSGVTPEVWQSFGKHKDTGMDAMSVWGFPEMKEYASTNKERVRMRGLNIGRQNDGTILINAMQIFGVDPLNPQSVQEGMEIGRKEAPHIVQYMKEHFSEFKDLELAGTAPELYVRESRHIQGEYRLTMADLLDNRDQWDAIAYGSYQVDIQSTNYQDPGAVMMHPKQYAVPFRSLVPKQVDGLLVVGRAASFDTLPHGSARVIPLGMATAQAAGVAAQTAIENNISFRQLSQSADAVKTMQDKLRQRKVELSMQKFDPPAYTKHKAYPGLKAAVSMFATTGGYDNMQWKLDDKSNAQRFVNNMLAVRKAHPDAFKGEPSAALKGMTDPAKQPLTLEQAALTLGNAMGLKTLEEKTIRHLTERGWIRQETIKAIEQPAALTNGDAFMLIRDIVATFAGKTYE